MLCVFQLKTAVLESSACSLDSQVRHWARSPHSSASLMQCITHTHVLVHRGSAQLTHSLCSARSSGSAPASVRAMAEPEQEAQPEAAVTQLDSTQSVDEYGIPRDTPAPVTPPEAFLGGPRFAGRGPTFTPQGSTFVSRPPELGKGRGRDVYTDPYREGPGQWLPEDLVKGGYWSIDERAVRAAGWTPLPQWSRDFDWDSRIFDPIEALQRGWVPPGADLSTVCDGFRLKGKKGKGKARPRSASRARSASADRRAKGSSRPAGPGAGKGSTGPAPSKGKASSGGKGAPSWNSKGKPTPRGSVSEFWGQFPAQRPNNSPPLHVPASGKGPASPAAKPKAESASAAKGKSQAAGPRPPKGKGAGPVGAAQAAGKGKGKDPRAVPPRPGMLHAHLCHACYRPMQLTRDELYCTVCGALSPVDTRAWFCASCAFETCNNCCRITMGWIDPDHLGGPVLPAPVAPPPAEPILVRDDGEEEEEDYDL